MPAARRAAQRAGDERSACRDGPPDARLRVLGEAAATEQGTLVAVPFTLRGTGPVSPIAVHLAAGGGVRIVIDHVPTPAPLAAGAIQRQRLSSVTGQLTLAYACRSTQRFCRTRGAVLLVREDPLGRRVAAGRLPRMLRPRAARGARPARRGQPDRPPTTRAVAQRHGSPQSCSWSARARTAPRRCTG